MKCLSTIYKKFNSSTCNNSDSLGKNSSLQQLNKLRRRKSLVQAKSKQKYLDKISANQIPYYHFLITLKLSFYYIVIKSMSFLANDSEASIL